MRNPTNGFTHREMLLSVARLQAKGKGAQKRLSWLEEPLKASTKGQVVYFVGCVPYSDVLFGSWTETGLLDTPRAAVRLLNSQGIEPVILADEVCCGLDFYLNGEEETLRQLAARNVELLKAAGAETVLTACSDGAFMLHQYASLGFQHGCEVMHIAEYLADELEGISLPEKTAILPSRTVGQRGASEAIDVSELASIFSEGSIDLSKGGLGPFEIAASGWLPENADAKRRLDRFVETAIDRGCERIATTSPRALMCFRHAQRAGAWLGSHIEVEDLTVLLSRLIHEQGR